mmetsp:Transcript_28286/g.41668  ORF Transcript_28286/g.41668 Transcript_28286/m.41668 type:complete len:88 (-) Transcript_28286:1232-1495(-)
MTFVVMSTIILVSTTRGTANCFGGNVALDTGIFHTLCTTNMSTCDCLKVGPESSFSLQQNTAESAVHKGMTTFVVFLLLHKKVRNRS